MALQNIGAGNKDDAFYRYKMPRMITKIEGSGNGKKTNVVNMVDIAKALSRPASYTTKYFGCELGAQSKFDEKTGTSLVNGPHETAKLAELLEKFIKKFVQCYGCGNPETEIIITKSQMINLNCIACGFISLVDMRDKLTTFILSEAKKDMTRLKKGEVKKLKKKGSSKDIIIATTTRATSKNKNEDNHASEYEATPNDDDTDDDDDVQWMTDTSYVSAQERIKEQLNAVTASMVMLSNSV